MIHKEKSVLYSADIQEPLIVIHAALKIAYKIDFVVTYNHVLV